MPERRFRVLFIASHPVQYQGQLFRRMAASPELDLQVAYCSLHGAEPNLDPEFQTVIQWDVPMLEGYEWTHVRNTGSGAESFFGLRNPGLWSVIRKGRFDAVISFVGYVRATFWIACLASKISNAAFLFGTDAISLAPRDGRFWKVPIKKFLWPWLFRLADQVIVPSSSSRELLLSLNLPSDSVTVAPYCVDNDWWVAQSKKVDRPAVRASWGATKDEVVILFCAKLQPWKRPLDLLHAFAKAKLSNALLVFAGEGPLRTQLEAEAAALGIAPRVRMLGFVNQSQLPALYTASDLLVLPSEFEPFGVVVNEAMCCGCPVAVSDKVGAGPDLVEPVNPNFVFPAGDVDALAGLIYNAVSNPSGLREISQRCVAHIQSWSPERNMAETVDAIRLAVSRKQPATMDEPSISTSKSSI